MFNEISPTDFIKGSMAVTGIYYLVILIIFYNREIGEFMRSRSFLSNESVELEHMMPNNDHLAELENKVNEINGILELAGKDADKTALLTRLKESIDGFGGLAIPAWKVAVYNHIITESGMQCGVKISEEELHRKG